MENEATMENLAGDLAVMLERMESPQDAAEATLFARTLAILQMSAIETLQSGLAEWTLVNGPVFIDNKAEQAYGHWEKRTTTISEEAELWVFLSEHGHKVENYKRADLSILKALNTSEEKPDGLERFIGTDITYSFGLKKNLVKKPKKAAGSMEIDSVRPKLVRGLGPEGVVYRAKVVAITPGPLPETKPSCSVMPPERVVAKVVKKRTNKR